LILSEIYFFLIKQKCVSVEISRGQSMTCAFIERDVKTKKIVNNIYFDIIL